jgi:type I restriction enzyme S subunit
MSELQCVKFGDMAQQITTKVNPKDTLLDTYVGLEHLDSGSLQINRHGTPKDVIGEKLHVSKGDIIFGKRRAYQRKLAIADFDGICSAHAMILRPKEDVVDKEFFPFFMQSDVFMERALQISVGSLSPTINWKTLANQEFTIPSLSDQHRFAIIFQAAEDCIVNAERFVAVAGRAKQVLRGELFSKGIGHTEFKKSIVGKIPLKWDIVRAEEIAKIVRGRFSHRPRNDPKFYGGNIPFIQTGDVVLSDGVVSTYSQTLNETGLSVSKIFPKGTMVMTIAANIGYTAVLGFNSAFPDSLVAIYPKDQIDKLFLRYYFVNEQPEIDRNAIKGTQKNINVEFINSWLVKIPPLPEQRQIATLLTRCDETITAARANVTAAKALKMKMINEMLNPGN